MDLRVLVAVALAVLGAGLVLNLVFLRTSRDDAPSSKNRTLMGGSSICYVVAGLVLLFAAFQF